MANPFRIWSTALSTHHLPTLEAYLKDAVDSEQYELASMVRDRIKEVIETRSRLDRDFPGIITVEPPY